MNIEINIFNEQKHGIDETPIKGLVREVWCEESGADANLNIVFVGEKRIAELNAQYFKKKTTTDVIAFSLTENGRDLFEGEVYICVDEVFKNADFYQVSTESELKRVVAHGLLHLAGYRDETVLEKRQMTDKENYYLKRGE